MSQFLESKLVCFAIILQLFISLPNYSQAQSNYQYLGWAAVFGSVKISKAFGLHLESQIRSNDKWKEVSTLIFRTGLIYNINSNQNAIIGYALIGHHRTVDSVSGWGPEHRIWEQYILNLAANPGYHFVTIQNRLRLEQRFISTSVANNGKLETKGYNFSQRLRYFVRAIIPILPSQEKRFQNGLFISLQDEIFVNLSDASGTNGKFFDQNRAYVSLGYRFSPKFDTEVGYMYQFIAGKGSSKTNNSILQLAVYFRL